jgi:hypothetical protein
MNGRFRLFNVRGEWPLSIPAGDGYGSDTVIRWIQEPTFNLTSRPTPITKGGRPLRAINRSTWRIHAGPPTDLHRPPGTHFSASPVMGAVAVSTRLPPGRPPSRRALPRLGPTTRNACARNWPGNHFVAKALVACLDRGDSDHIRCTASFANYHGQLVTAWPMLTEVCRRLPRHIGGRFMRRVAAGGVAVRDMPPTAADDIAIHMEQCNDLPVDLAEASLVWPAGELGICEVDLPTKPRPVFTAGDFGLHAGSAHE